MRLGIATQIFAGFSLLLLATLVLAFLSVREIRAVGEDMRALRDGHLTLARSVAQLESHQQNRDRDLRRALEEPDPDSRVVLLRIARSYYPGVIDSTLAELDRACDRWLGSSDGGRRARSVCRGLRTRLDPIARASSDVDALARDMAAEARVPGALAPFTAPLAERGEALRSAVFELDRFLRAETDRAVARAEREERNAVWRVVGTAVGALGLGLLLTLRAARALGPIRPLVRYARALARGDYQQPLAVKGGGELAALADELRRMARARDDREEKLDRQAKELERAYLRVAELKRYHERVVRSLRAGVVVTDPSGAVTSTNRAAETEWGLEGVIGLRIADLALGPALAPHFGSIEAASAAEGPRVAEAIPVGGRLADVVVAPLESEGGETLGVIVALEDVTEAVRTKEALLRSERLAAVGRMSAHVTHELRNPLASIALNADLLDELFAEAGGPEAEEARALCQAIGREADRLTGLTEEYLKFARLPRPELTTIRPDDLLGPIARFVEPDCRAASVTLELDVEPGLPALALDPDQMRQALLNLLRNGKEAMPKGGRLVLGARRLDDGGVALSVEDEGAGIDPASLDRIFDPFYSTKLTGTGLGLALTQQIVQEHGARLEVTSTLGAGTEFRVRFPSPEEEGARPADPVGARPVSRSS